MKLPSKHDFIVEIVQQLARFRTKKTSLTPNHYNCNTNSCNKMKTLFMYKIKLISR